VVDPWQPELDPAWIAALLLAALDYALLCRFLARRGEPVAHWRRACFAAGLVLVALALLSPIEHIALRSMLSFHLLQNVMIADWAPPLLVAGLSPAMARAAERRALMRALTRPGVAFSFWVSTWYVLHVPAVYGYALSHDWALGLEHLAFLCTGIAFWWPVLQPGRMRSGPRVVYLFGAYLLASPVALGIALAATPLYGFYASAPKLFGLSALADQQIGGMLMALEQSVILFAACWVAFARLLAEEEREVGLSP
jgi:cytochrome c oxidase assembly factor CtaG